ncbi:MAG: VWA domain-containing protein [Gammaproteobacteria bacterium]|nr:VWA domain-containing protein [Gammaproteobacteria bacterium]
MPAEFHWLRPEWLWALPVAAIVALTFARRQLAPGSWQRVVDPALVPYVLSREQVRASGYRWWLVLLGGVLAALAMAGPSWDRVEQPVFRSEQAIVVALDLSRSMDAQDVSPSRLTRARLKILDILERRRSGQTALIVYSSNAFTVTPLTSDTDTVAALVNSLSTDIMPSRGSYPPAAINKGLKLLQQAGVRFGEVLMMTDGGTSPAAELAAKELKEAGYSLSVLGVGTSEGAPIPRPGGGFVTDRSGQLAVPKLEINELKDLAAAGGGRYATLTADDRDLTLLLSGEVGRGAETDQSLATDQWREEGPWLLLLLVPLAALAFRRGWVLCFVFFALPVPQTAYALDWVDLWKTRDQQASALLADGNAAEAAAIFEDPLWEAVARYRASEYEGSAQRFAGFDDADSLYNFGNALARMGEFEPAIDAYERVLEMNPDAEDAAYNRDLVKEMLQQQDSQSGEQGDEQSSEEGDGQQSEGESESDQSGEEGADGEPGDDSGEGDESSRDQEMSEEDLAAIERELERAAQEAQQQAGEGDEDEELSQAEAEAQRRVQEQQQAMEQWLRRIPNDPGGLLRRKFRYQYQRQGRDQDGNNLWPDDEVQPW